MLFISVLTGAALSIGGAGRESTILKVIAEGQHVLFRILGFIMRLAPIGAFGAMAFTVGRYGVASLLALGKLMAGVYLTCAFFVFGVLGVIAAATGFSLIKFLRYIGEEILIVPRLRRHPVPLPQTGQIAGMSPRSTSDAP